MWESFYGSLRDIVYHLTKKSTVDFYGCIIGLFIMGFIVCSMALLFSGADKGNYSYCHWKAEKGISKIVTVFEYAPRKTACWIWLDEGWQDYGK